MTSRPQTSYRLLRALYEASRDGSSVDYRTLLTGVDELVLREAANWLVESGNAYRRPNGTISITAIGRRFVESRNQ